VRAALQLDLRHHGVAGDLGAETGETIAGAAADAGRVVGRGGEADGLRSQARRVVQLPAGRVLLHLDRPCDNPASHGVVTHPEEGGSLADPIMRHKSNIITANADASSGLRRVAGPGCEARSATAPPAPAPPPSPSRASSR